MRQRKTSTSAAERTADAGGPGRLGRCARSAQRFICSARGDNLAIALGSVFALADAYLLITLR